MKSGYWGVEYLCRLRLDDSLCERQARMFICGQDFYTVTFQGSSHTQFEYWKGMFEFVMLTVAAVNFSVPDWFVDQTAVDGGNDCVAGWGGSTQAGFWLSLQCRGW